MRDTVYLALLASPAAADGFVVIGTSDSRQVGPRACDGGHSCKRLNIELDDAVYGYCN